MSQRHHKVQSKMGPAELFLNNQLLDVMNQSVFVTDPEFNIVYVNKACTDTTGYGREEVLGANLDILCSERNNGNFQEVLRHKIREDDHWQGEVWMHNKTADGYAAWLSMSPLRDQRGGLANYAGISFNITPMKQNEQRLLFMAHFDVLTNLPNRVLMYDRLRQALALARRGRYQVAVMLLDLDRFKEINDTLGHHVGDLLLVEAAARLLSCVRETDTIARMGGDEFLAILPDIGSAPSAAHIAQDLLEKLARPFHIDGHDLFVSASIGITMYPNDSQDENSILKNADTAMYHAKAQGKNNYKFFTEDINKSTIERFMLESRFRRALEKLEFHLNYQPKVDLHSGSITGIEALLRWYHPEQGSVMPTLFIPLAEETGLVIPLGEWAIREACRQNKAWQDDGLPPLVVSVNLSARHFPKNNLAEMISGVLDETGLDPKYLMLEITESALMENVEETIRTLNALRDMGLRISLDDFGTGYSSLNYLNRFPIDELKIDKSFIADTSRSADSRRVVSAIIVLAHTLKLRVIAEGVETEEQLSFLRQNQCDEVQGFYFSKPLSSEQLKKLIRKGLVVTEAGQSEIWEVPGAARGTAGE